MHNSLPSDAKKSLWWKAYLWCKNDSTNFDRKYVLAMEEDQPQTER